MKIYLASPFFTEFTIIVKQRMLEKVRQTYPDAEIFDPESTNTSKTYGETTNPNTREFLAKKIFEENCQNIISSDILVFPQYTTDLGTLFEVGYAWGLRNKICRYNYLYDSLSEPASYAPPPMHQDPNGKFYYLADTLHVVLFGCHYAMGFNELKYYLPESMKDNVMFSANFDKVDMDGKVVSKDWSEAE